jgi:hypothetical protein
MLQSENACIRALRPRHGCMRILRPRRTGLLTLLLPWSLWIVGRPLRVELRCELVRVHGSFILVDVQDHVEGEQHQGWERGIIWMKNCVVVAVVDWKIACTMQATYVGAERGLEILLDVQHSISDTL